MNSENGKIKNSGLV